MKIFAVVFFTLVVQILFGQSFAIIKDEDGFCNVRSKEAIGNNILDTLHNGHIVCCFETKGNWTTIEYGRKKNNLLSGLIYTNRLKFISDYLELPESFKTANQIKLSRDSIKVVVTQMKFDKFKYKFSYHKEYKTQIEFINGKQYWGSDGGIPTSEYKSIEIFYGKRKVVLPQAAIENLFEPSLYNTQVHYDVQNDVLYIESGNSDGAGAYMVIWKIAKGIYKERYIAYGF